MLETGRPCTCMVLSSDALSPLDPSSDWGAIGCRSDVLTRILICFCLDQEFSLPSVACSWQTSGKAHVCALAELQQYSKHKVGLIHMKLFVNSSKDQSSLDLCFT